MNSRKTSPTTQTSNPLGVLFGKSRVRPVAIFIILATLATAGFSATSSAGSLHRIIFGKFTNSTAPGVSKGVTLRANASGGQLQDGANAAAATTSSAGVARHGHTATLLDNGKVLVVGGDESGSAEVFDASSSTSAVTGGLSIPRFDHTATKLSDGRVIVIGGRSGGTAVASAEIYNTTTGSFEAGPSMGVARAGHSATLLSDGRILVAGGDAAGSVEIYDPSSNSFSADSATLNDARSGHSAALMNDGRVLIVGGRDAGGNELASAEVYNGAGFNAVGGGMAHHRVGAHLRVLPDAKVQVIGGNDDDSMEVYDPATNQFGAHGHLIPVTDPDAALLEDDILGAQTRAAFFHHGQTDAARDREEHTITEVPQAGMAVVLGGVNSDGVALDSAVVFNSSGATVTTDRLDYQPGDIATISGTGWQAGETVNIILHEDPHTHTERRVAPVADAEGNFTATYLVEAHDINVKFIIGAKGAASGRTAQTTFTDSVGVTAATGGTNISADKAANATAPAFTPLGNIVVSEGAAGGANTDFADTAGVFKTLILSAPSGWTFNAGQGSVSAQGGRDIVASPPADAPTISITSSTITVSFKVSGTTKTDILTVSGIQVRPTDGANIPSSGNILKTGGTATITGIDGTTNFGSLSQVVGAVSKLVVTLPGQTFADGSTVAASGNTGTPTAQTAGTSFNISNLRATDQFFNVVTTYSGAKTISYTGPGTNSGFAAPSYTTAVSFTGGVSTTTLVTTLRKAETTTITASDGTTSGPASSSLTVNAGALSAFAVTNTSDGAISSPQTAGTAFNLKVRAVDAGGNTITSFDGGSNKVMISPSSGTLSAGGGTSDAFVNGVLSPWSVTFSTSGTYPGTFSLTATGIGGNSSITGTSNLFTVNAPPCTTPVVTSPTNQTVTYGNNATFTASATGTPAPTLQWQSSPNGTTWTDIPSATASPLTVTAPTVAQSGTQYRAVFTNTCGSVNSNAATLTVNPKTLTPTVTVNNKVYDGTTAATVATRSLAGVVGTDDATLGTSGTAAFVNATAGNGKTVNITGLALSGTTAGNYQLSSTSTTATADITKAHLTVTADDKSKTYDGATFTAFTSTISGFVNSETESGLRGSGALSGSAGYTGAATTAVNYSAAPYTITPTIGTLTATNYDFPAANFVNGGLTINKRPATWTTNNSGKTYGDADPTPLTTGSGSNFVAGDGVTATYSRAAGETVAGGPYHITATLSAVVAGVLDNYDVINAGADFSIAKRGATWTTNPSGKTYGDADPSPLTSGSGTNFVPADGVSATYSRAAGETVAGVPYHITATLSAATSGALDNYNVTNEGASFAISKRDATWTTNDSGKTYGDADPTPITTGSGDFLAADGVSATYSRAAGETVGGGPYHSTATLSATVPGALENYNITNAGANFSITKRSATWTTNDGGKIYGDADPSPLTSGSGSNFVAGDDVTASYTRAAGETVAGGPYHITATLSSTIAGALDNYNVTNNGADFSIAKRNATWLTNPNSKTYGDADPSPVTTGSGSNFIAGDGVSAAYSRAAGETVGGGPYHITATLSAVVAGALDNYTVTNSGANFTINKKAASVTPNGASKTYGDADPAPLTTGTLNGFLTGDNVTATYSRAAGETVAGGPYTISATLSPAGVLGNYDITYNTTNFTINKATLTVTADNQTKLLNAPNPTFTASYSGFKNGETLATSGVTGSPSLTTTAVTNSPVGTYPITAAVGTLASGNYTFAFAPGTLSVVYATGGMCLGEPGRTILQPINADGTSIFKQKSTVPAKFRVCDANGVSIGTPGVVTGFFNFQVISGTMSVPVEDVPVSTTPDTAFRWSSSDQQWIFNINTKNLAINKTYVYKVMLNDGSSFNFQYGLK